jgi:hypothetical protein
MKERSSNCNFLRIICFSEGDQIKTKVILNQERTAPPIVRLRTGSNTLLIIGERGEYETGHDTATNGCM